MQHTRRDLLKLGAAAPLVPLAAGTTPQAERPLERPGVTPNTRFAVNIEMWWTELPFLERIERAANLGFPAVEFWPWRNKDLDAVAETCRRFGVDVAQFTAWGFTPGLNEPRNHDAFVKEVEASCEAAHKLGTKLLTVVAGNDVEGRTTMEMHAAVFQGLRRAAPIVEREGITLILEPMNGRVDHPGHCLYGSEAAIRICEAVDSPNVRINWDLYHMQVSEGDLCGRLRDGFPWVGYVQLADHPGRHEPGTGEIHYPRVLFELNELGYDGYVGLECRPQGDELQAAKRVAAADRF